MRCLGLTCSGFNLQIDYSAFRLLDNVISSAPPTRRIMLVHVGGGGGGGGFPIEMDIELIWWFMYYTEMIFI